MKRWLYDLGFSLFGIFAIPPFLRRLKQAENPRRLLSERFGFFSQNVSPLRQDGPCLWIHTVSVGEALAVRKFLDLLLERKTALSLLLTTVTPTGQRIAKKWEGERLRVAYFPFDLRFSVKRFFDTFKPIALLLVETEIWPNVIEEARGRGVPIGVINGRISDRSFRAFRFFSPIFSPLLKAIDFFLVQTPQDRERLLALGVDSRKVQVTGNMKLDALALNGSWHNDRQKLRQAWGFLPDELVLMGGSTHQGEERVLFRLLRKLRAEGFPLKLFLAPRHIERSPHLMREAKKEGFQAVLASTRNPSLPFEVLILDRIGELPGLYPVADAVFMGGSLIRHGGQNPVEAVAVRRAIVHGPWVFNFHEIYSRLEEGRGSLKVKGEEEFELVLKRILASERERKGLGDRAFKVLEKMRGATERNLDWISRQIKLENFGRSYYVS